MDFLMFFIYFYNETKFPDSILHKLVISTLRVLFSKRSWAKT
jgi:hypothetical protein